MNGKTKISRRGFLVLVGGALGTPVLASYEVTPLGKQQPVVESIESSYKKEKDMKSRILIAYASRCGSTGGVAEAIGQTFCGIGAGVDVRLVGDVNDLSPYRAVIVGSAIRMGKWLPEVVEFLKTHQDRLSRVPVAYFVVCMTMKDDTVENRRKVLAYLDPVQKQVPPVKPADIGLFAGGVDFKKLSFIHSLILKVMGVPEGDFRNWEAIRTWVAGMGPVLLGV